jgi:hypothetical protein
MGIGTCSPQSAFVFVLDTEKLSMEYQDTDMLRIHTDNWIMSILSLPIMSKRPRKLPVKLADQKQVFVLNVVNQATDVTSRSGYSGGGRAH